MRIKIPRESLHWPAPVWFEEFLPETSEDIFLDFSNVEFLTGAALGKLVSLHKKLRSSGKQLVLHNVNLDVYEILAVTGLTRLFSIDPAPQGAR